VFFGELYRYEEGNPIADVVEDGFVWTLPVYQRFPVLSNENV
jgi:hypothetical protein